MPHIRIRGMQPEQVQKLTENVTSPLAKIINTSVDNFTFEHIQSFYFANGKSDSGYPFVEVLWFERSQEIKDQCAQFLTQRIKALVADVDVAIVFFPMEKTDYFENGEHF